MQVQELKYEILFDEIQKISLSGIERALTFVKFAETGSYDLEKVNTPPRIERHSFSNDFMPPIHAAEFQKWKDDFVAWNLNNAVNEIIESFFVFLEMSYFVLHANGDRRRVNSGEVLGEVIKNWQNDVRNDLRTKNKIHALSDKGLQFSDDEKKIIESFWEIRNLLSHNLGVADNRKRLVVDQGKITLRWYRREIFAKLESGREIQLTGDPLPEAGDICMRTKVGQTKEIDLNTHISFTLDEVQQIAWTFWLLVYDVSAKIKTVLDQSGTESTHPEKR